MTPKLIIMEIPINRSAKCHNHSQLSKQFLVLELGMIPNYLLPFQIINYHHTTYDHSFVYYHIWCIYTYIYVCVSIMYIHVHIYIYISICYNHSFPIFCPSVTVTSRSVPPLRFQKHRDPPHPLIARIPPAQVFPGHVIDMRKGGNYWYIDFQKLEKRLGDTMLYQVVLGCSRCLVGDGI